MLHPHYQDKFDRFSLATLFARGLLLLLMLVAVRAHALPVFARQTGQNCLSCHAGGQWPELTPYGRMFKLTGYTIGARTLPLAVMGVFSEARVADTSKSDSPSADFQKNGRPLFATGSLFLAGKVTDNIGAFAQITYDNYASQGEDGSFHGFTSADNMDFRYADHLVDAQRDLIYGVSLNNNPSVSDVWNTAAAWMQYVPVPSPSAYQFIDGNTPFPGFGAGGNIAGVSAYVFLDRTWYGELGTYRTANGPFSFLSFNSTDANTTHLAGGYNPYWRFAWSHEWGAQNVMLGTSGMIAHVYDGGSDIGDSANLGEFRNTGLDLQYQYLLDPHTFTFQLAYARQEQHYSAATLAAGPAAAFFNPDGSAVAAPSASDTTHVLRAKVSYVYQARYGGSLAIFNLHGSTNTLNQTSGFDPLGQITSGDPNGTGTASLRVNGNLSGNPATRGTTYEAFWLPTQYVRVGMQYTDYSTYNGAGSNYDGFGRDAGDNNTLFLYVWANY
jgi:hypothetical protein